MVGLIWGEIPDFKTESFGTQRIDDGRGACGYDRWGYLWCYRHGYGWESPTNGDGDGDGTYGEGYNNGSGDGFCTHLSISRGVSG